MDEERRHFSTGLTPRLAAPDQELIIHYVETRRTSDGGYFFARIPPSSAYDTYYATATLRLLGRNPTDADGVIGWLKKWAEGTPRGHTHPAFLAAGILHSLSHDAKTVRRFLRNHFGWRPGNTYFNSPRQVYIEVVSPLETLYEEVTLYTWMEREVDKEEVIRFLERFHNGDGGFGPDSRSTLASSFYAAKVLSLLGYADDLVQGLERYFREQEKDRLLYFLEDLYWLVGGLNAIGQEMESKEAVAGFVLECQRQNGGFARAALMGIPTLEYTFYAVSLLAMTGLLSESSS